MHKLSLTVATILAAAAFSGTANAKNQGCTVTIAKSGYQFHSLNASKNLTCAQANQLLAEALNLSYGNSPKGLRCTQTPQGSGGRLTCDATDNSARHIDSTWSMPSQRR